MTEKLLLKGSLEVLDLVGFSFLFPIIFFPNNGEKYSQKNVAMCFCFKVVGSLSTKSETEDIKERDTHTQTSISVVRVITYI